MKKFGGTSSQSGKRFARKIDEKKETSVRNTDVSVKKLGNSHPAIGSIREERKTQQN